MDNLTPGTKVKIINVDHPMKQGVIICKSELKPTQYLVENRSNIDGLYAKRPGRAWFYPENLV